MSRRQPSAWLRREVPGPQPESPPGASGELDRGVIVDQFGECRGCHPRLQEFYINYPDYPAVPANVRSLSCSGGVRTAT